jgi:hypothetical protein
VLMYFLQNNGHITYEKYNIRSAEEDNNRRRTIAVGDVILPVGYLWSFAAFRSGISLYYAGMITCATNIQFRLF